jgi:hypothetical protein
LGPVLFNILLEFCLRSANIVDIGVQMVTVDKSGIECPVDLVGHRFTFREGGYADDLYFVADRPEKLTRALNRLQEICGSIGLDISAGKTEWLWLYQTDAKLCRNITNCCAQVRLNDQIIKHCRQFCYLGSVISEGGGVSEALGKRIESARAALDRIEGRWTDCRSRGKRIKQIHAEIFPLLLYGTESFPMRKEEYKRLEVFLNRVRLRILGRKRLVDDITLTNEELQQLVQLPSAVRLILPRRLMFLIKLAVDSACVIARKSIWMEIEAPAEVRSGPTISHHPRGLGSEMLFLLENSNGLLGIEEGNWSQDVKANIVWNRLKALYADSTTRLTDILNKICAASTQTPCLKGRPERKFFCKHENCSQAYKEQKFLSRHVREAHPDKGDQDRRKPKVIALSLHSEQSVTGTEEPVTIQERPAGFHCSYCSKVYKTSGWLTRHLKTAHEVLSSPKCKPQTVGIPSSRAEVPLAKEDRGLTCEICGQGATKGKRWGEKTLKNHMAAAHKLNAKTGKASRTRSKKENTAN